MPLYHGGETIRGFISGSCHFFRYEGIALLVLGGLIWKRKIQWHSPLGWILVSAILLTLATSNKGTAGGAFYYMALFVLIFWLKTSASWWNRYGRKAAMILVPVICFALTCQFFFMKDIDYVFQNIISAPKEKGICVVDWPVQKGKIPWILQGAVPENKNSQRFVYCGRLFGVENFWVYFRRTKIDERFYSEFDGLSPSEVHIRACSNGYIIRLPENYLLSDSIFVYDDNGTCLKLCQKGKNEWDMFDKMINHVRGRELGYYEEDCHNGAIYILLPREIQSYQRLEIKYTPNVLFGSVPRTQRPKLIETELKVP